MDSPKDELRTICETLKEALATDRMGNEPDFAEFVYKELSIGLMQKLAKTISFDPEVSSLTIALTPCPTLVSGNRRRHYGGVYRPFQQVNAAQAIQRVVHLRDDVVLPA